jgi:hypothetical protein
MESDFLIPFIFFTFLAAVILVPVLAKERTKRSAHSLISLAISRGQELDPATIARMTDEMLENGNRARRSLGNGVVLLGLAGGFIAAGFVISGFDHDGDVIRGMAVPAVLLGSVGVAFLLLAIIDYATKRREA